MPLEETLLDQQPLLKTHLVDPMLATLQLADQHVYAERVIAGKRTIRFIYSTSSVGAPTATS